MLSPIVPRVSITFDDSLDSINSFGYYWSSQRELSMLLILSPIVWGAVII